MTLCILMHFSFVPIIWNHLKSISFCLSLSFRIFLMAESLSIYQSTCLYFVLILKTYFCWAYNSSWQLFSFRKYLKISLHSLLLLTIAPENLAVSLLHFGGKCVFFLQNLSTIFIFTFICYNVILMFVATYFFYLFCLRFNELLKSEDWYLSTVLEKYHLFKQ